MRYLDSSDLCCDRGVLAGKNIEAEPCGRGYPTILLVSNDLEQLGCAVAPLCRDNAESARFGPSLGRKRPMRAAIAGWGWGVATAYPYLRDRDQRLN